MKSSTQLESETEEARARVNATLEELRARTTPGQLVDQVIEYARGSGGGAFVGNLKSQVVNNPLPVVLLGASLIWLAFANARPSRRDGGYAADRAIDNLPEGRARLRGAAQSTADAAADAAAAARDGATSVAQSARSAVDAASQTASDTLQDIRERASGTYEDIRERASGTYEDIRERASGTYEDIRQRASGTYDKAAASTRRAASSLREAMTEGRQTVGDLSRNFTTLCKEQPILMASAGVALGATLGALLPASDAENRAMGEVSDDVKLRARRLSERVKEGAQAVYSEAKDAAGDAIQANAQASAELGHS